MFEIYEDLCPQTDKPFAFPPAAHACICGVIMFGTD